VVVLVSSSLKIKFMNEITHDELSFSHHIISPLHREDNLMFLSLYLSATREEERTLKLHGYYPVVSFSLFSHLHLSANR